MATRAVCLRRSFTYVTDTNGFIACHDSDGDGTPINFGYDAGQGFGFVSTSGVQARDRNSSNDPAIAGMAFTSTNGISFRLDLPDGAGTYKVYAACIDQLGSMVTGWRFRDGTAGTNFVTLSTSSNSTNYVDISNTQQAATGFDFATENSVTHTFTDSFMTVTRDTSIASGNAALSAVWVELDGSPPAASFYNPFQNKRFNPNYTRRIR